jgi:hypothetical protein
MNRPLLASSFFIGLFLLARTPRPHAPSASPDDNTAYVIDGVVRSENGVGADSAAVYATPMDRPRVSITPHAIADKSGRFIIRNLWPGKYAVGAEKLDEDYPDNSSQFFSGGKFPTVVLTQGNPIVHTEVRLGPQAGVLTGTVSDAITGAPLSPCVQLTRASEPNNFLRGSGLMKRNYKLLVPPNTGVFLKLWLDGYEAWYFPDGAAKSKSVQVNLKPGQVEPLDIRLRPGRNMESGCPRS